MGKDPAILFYTSDFLTGTLLMTDEQVGKYIRLLCLQHQKDRLSEKDMLKICKTYDEDIFMKFQQDEDGFFFNQRMKLEMEKRQKYSESRRKNRSKKYNKIKEGSEDMSNISKTYVPHMENENENDNRDRSIKDPRLLKNNIEERAREFRQSVLRDADTKYPKSMLTEFIDYWNEPNKSSTALQHEGEKSFDLAKQLATWHKKGQQFVSSLKDSEGYYEQITFSFWLLFKLNMQRYGVNSTDIEKAKVKNWLPEINRMVELDNRTEDEIRNVHAYLQNEQPKTNDFAWSKTVRSPQSLRKNFERILLEARNSSTKPMSQVEQAGQIYDDLTQSI